MTAIQIAEKFDKKITTPLDASRLFQIAEYIEARPDNSLSKTILTLLETKSIDDCYVIFVVTYEAFQGAFQAMRQLQYNCDTGLHIHVPEIIRLTLQEAHDYAQSQLKNQS